MEDDADDGNKHSPCCFVHAICALLFQMCGRSHISNAGPKPKRCSTLELPMLGPPALKHPSRRIVPL